MRSVDESQPGLATIRGTPRVATPHNLRFSLSRRVPRVSPKISPSLSLPLGEHRIERKKEKKKRFVRSWISSWIGVAICIHFRSLPGGNMLLEGSVANLARLLWIVGLLLNVVTAVIKGNTDYQHYQQQLPGDHFAKDFYRSDSKNGLLSTYARFKPITDCMFVTSEPGSFVYTSKTIGEEVCGVYFLAEPDQKVEMNFITFDVPCEHRGLVSVVDGWELNGEVFPGEMDHRLPLNQRSSEFCGKNISVKRTFTSSQNVAVIQYRIPMPGKGFTVLARFVRNPRPCNVLTASINEPFTLRNYGRRINCTYVALYPGTVEVIALGVGVSNFLGSVRATETGTLRKCDEVSPNDQVVIGGSYGLDTSKVQMIDSICGIDSKPDYRELVEYGVTSVRLISSGFFDNFITVQVQPVKDDLLDANLSI